MLRNLNQSASGQRILGTCKSGVLAELIPSTGDQGPAYTYNDLTLPADNGKEIRGFILTWPSAGTLFAWEDTSFTFIGPDGVYTFTYQLYVNGVATGSPATVTITITNSVAIVEVASATSTCSAVLGSGSFNTTITEVGVAVEVNSSSLASTVLALESGNAVAALGAVAAYSASNSETGSAVDTEAALMSYLASGIESGSAAETISAVPAYYLSLMEQANAIDASSSMASGTGLTINIKRIVRGTVSRRLVQ